MNASDPAVMETILRRPRPPDVLDDARPVVVHDRRLSEILDRDARLMCLYDQASFSDGTVWEGSRGRLV